MSENELFGNVTIVKKIIGNQPIVLENPLILQKVPFLPTTISFVIYGAVYTNIKKNKLTINLEIIDQQGHQPIDINGEMHNDNRSIELPILEINIDVDGAIFRNTGKHTCKLTVEDHIVDEYSFYIQNENFDLKGVDTDGE